MPLPPEPLSAVDATALLRRILMNGAVSFTGHAQERMDEQDLIETDVVNVLRRGLMLQPAEFERGHVASRASWRYRFETERMFVVVAFRSDDEVVVVTVRRLKGRGQ